MRCIDSDDISQAHRPQIARLLISTPATDPLAVSFPRFAPSRLWCGQLLDLKDRSFALRGSSAIFDRRRPIVSCLARRRPPGVALGPAVGRFVRWRCCCCWEPRHVTNGGSRKQPIRANTSTHPRSLQITLPAGRPAETTVSSPEPRSDRPPVRRSPLSAIFQVVIPATSTRRNPSTYQRRDLNLSEKRRNALGTDRQRSTLMHRLSPVNPTPTRYWMTERK